MNIAINQSLTHKDTLIWAIICSVLLHVLLAWLIPNIQLDAIKTPDILKVVLVQKPEPQPVVEPEPVQPPPEVTKPKIKPKPKLQPQPIPLPTPLPVVEEIEPTPAPPPEIIAATPKIEAAAAQTVPKIVPIEKPEPPPPPPPPSQSDISDARGKYGNTLWNAISKHKKYPRVAQMRGWQGEVIVELELDGNGKISSKKIAKSSGYSVLDNQALEMVEKALPFPVPPEVLRGSNFTITVPVPFKFE